MIGMNTFFFMRKIPWANCQASISDRLHINKTFNVTREYTSVFQHGSPFSQFPTIFLGVQILHAINNQLFVHFYFAEKVHPDYEVDLKFNFTYDGVWDGDCDQRVKNKVIEALQPVTEACRSIYLNITTQYFFEMSENYVGSLCVVG